MRGMYDVPVTDLIERLAEELKKVAEVKPPVWATFAKTGRHKERPPVSPDWWFVRAAAVLVSVAKLGTIGVSKLRTKYGGKRSRGVASEHHYKGSGSIIRKALQQLEKAGFVKQGGVRKGRLLTAKGASFISRAAANLKK